MAFTLRLSSGASLGDVADQTIVTTECSLNLVGRGAVNYAQAHSENFVHLLENFAGSSSPALPLVGQEWYDITTAQMKLWNGTAWTPVGGGGFGDSGSIGQGSRIAGFTGLVLTLKNGDKITIGVCFAEGQIINIVCSLSVEYALLPDTCIINDETYSLAPYFPNGFSPGLTLTAASGQDWGYYPQTVTFVDAQGANGISVTGGPITTTGTFTINLDNTGVQAGTYSLPVFQIDSTGRVVNAKSQPITLSVNGAMQGTVVLDGSSQATLSLSYVAVGGVVPITVENAIHANTADYATQAGLANRALEADHAAKADEALRAAQADNATNATNAGLAGEAFKLQYARNIALVGDVVGNANFDGSSNIQIQTTVGGLSNITPQIQNIVNNTLTIGRVPVNFVRVTNNIRTPVYTSSADWITCMGPIYYNKTRGDTNLIVIVEVSSYNPTLGGAGAVALRMLDTATGYTDSKGLSSAFQTAAGAYNAGMTAVYALIGGGAGTHAYYLQCARGDGRYFTTIFNPDNADFNGGAHTGTGATTSFTFMEIIP